MFSIDDDDPLEAMFNDITSSSIDISSGVKPSDSSTIDNDLAWLEENVLGNTANSPAGVGNETSTPMVNKSTTSVDIDDFFSEVFGDSTPVANATKLNLDSNMELAATDPSLPLDLGFDIGIDHPNSSNVLNSADISSTAESSTNELFKSSLLKELTSILNSSFPDVDRCRELLYEMGHIPPQLRCQVWHLLIAGKNLTPDIDEEAEQWHMQNSCEITYKDDIKNEVHGLLVSQAKFRDSIAIPEDDEEMLVDIFGLLCVRHSLDYSKYYSGSSATSHLNGNLSSILHPLIGMYLTGVRSRTQLSSSFYLLYSSYYPMLQHPQASKDIGLMCICNWLKLLTHYHIPHVGIKLESLLPYWYLPIDKGGLIPENWLMTYFSGSIPPQSACVLMDWCILLQERHMHIYLIVSLLSIYSELLMSCTTDDEVVQWFDVVSNKNIVSDWYTCFPINGRNSSDNNQAPSDTVEGKTNLDADSDSACNSWMEFMVGWMEVCNSVRKSTPGSFIDAFLNLDEYSTKRAQLLTQNSKSADAVTARTMEQELDLDTTSAIEDGLLVTPAAGGNCILVTAEEVVPSLCMNNRHRQTVDQNNDNEFHDRISRYRNSSKSDVSNVTVACADNLGTLPSMVDENNWNKLYYFGIDCRTEEQKVFGKFPKDFAVNCDHLLLDSDLDLLDIGNRGNASPLEELLITLGPLSEYTHLCLYGAGNNVYTSCLSDASRTQEFASAPGFTSVPATTSQQPGDYNNLANTASALGSNLFSSVKSITQQVTTAAANSSVASAAAGYLSDPVKQQQERDYIANLDSQIPRAVRFFVQRQFKHVSVLQGGFCAALQFLEKCTETGHMNPGPFPSNFSLETSLVDSDKKKLYSYMHGKSLSSLCFPIVYAAQQMKEIQLKQHARVKQLQQEGSGEETWRDSSVKPAKPISTTTVPVEEAKQLVGTIGKRLSIFGASSYDSIKKGVSAISAEVEAKRQQLHEQHMAAQLEAEKQAKAKKIEQQEKEILKAQQSKQMALANHYLSGLKVGDMITITKKDLPGAVLFPALNETEGVENRTASDEVVAEAEGIPQKHRFLAVTSERFIILDAKAGGIGSQASVEANHHLTEVRVLFVCGCECFPVQYRVYVCVTIRLLYALIMHMYVVD